MNRPPQSDLAEFLQAAVKRWATHQAQAAETALGPPPRWPARASAPSTRLSPSRRGRCGYYLQAATVSALRAAISGERCRALAAASRRTPADTPTPHRVSTASVSLSRLWHHDVWRIPHGRVADLLWAALRQCGGLVYRRLSDEQAQGSQLLPRGVGGRPLRGRELPERTHGDAGGRPGGGRSYRLGAEL